MLDSKNDQEKGQRLYMYMRFFIIFQLISCEFWKITQHFTKLTLILTSESELKTGSANFVFFRNRFERIGANLLNHRDQAFSWK